MIRFNHLGLAVRNPQAAKTFLGAQGYAFGEPVYDGEQNVNLIMCNHPALPPVEIVYPGKGDGPIDNLVARHANGIVYHMCYFTPSLEGAVRWLEQQGLRVLCVAQPKVGILFGGERAAFYQVGGMGLIELIEDTGLQSSAPA